MGNLEQLVNMERLTVISGDMNICLDKDPNCLLSTALGDLGFEQLVPGPTHTAGAPRAWARRAMPPPAARGRA